jgi:hypothetical protein
MGSLADIKATVKKNIIPIIGGVIVAGGIIYAVRLSSQIKATQLQVNMASGGGTATQTSAFVASRGLPMVRQLVPFFNRMWAQIVPVAVPAIKADK